MTPKGFLSEAEFLELIKTSVLPAIDLIVFNEKDQVLLGKRLNRPAQGFHFAAGGRIFKGETYAQAFKRIVLKELGIILLPGQYVRIRKKYRHDYDDNMFRVEGIGTHYAPTLYIVYIESSVQIKNDAQHENLRWWDIDEALADETVHQYTKQYIIDAL